MCVQNCLQLASVVQEVDAIGCLSGFKSRSGVQRMREAEGQEDRTKKPEAVARLRLDLGYYDKKRHDCACKRGSDTSRIMLTEMLKHAQCREQRGDAGPHTDHGLSRLILLRGPAPQREGDTHGAEHQCRPGGN